jgi:plastocyanin
MKRETTSGCLLLFLTTASLAVGAVRWTASNTQRTAAPDSSPWTKGGYYLPDSLASAIVGVTRTGSAVAEATILTQALVEKEAGPSATVSHFGEIYTFSPSFIAVRRDEPTQISFWNLQTDDDHDFMLVDPDLNVIMKVALAPLSKTSYLFTFHRTGLFTFYCTFHQPAMTGQILVLLPPSALHH